MTSRLQPTESTTLCDTVADPEDHNDAAGLADIDHFARFMRATQAPPVDATLAATADAKAGATLFNQIGCNICHVTSITTSPAGTVINGGAFTVPAALGSKIIHPYSDFLLHNVGREMALSRTVGRPLPTRCARCLVGRPHARPADA